MSDWLAERFEESRARLRAVAQRMLGSASEADDAVQEAWLKLSRADTRGVENLNGWLTTVVARVCLDMLRARRPRPEGAPEPPEAGSDPELEFGLADAIGPALLVVFDTLAPDERVAFVLHDMFDLSFEEIAPIVDRTPAAARQLASRARRRVRGAEAPSAAPNRALVSAFLAASRDGDFEGLLAVLSPDAVLRADELAVRTAAAREKHGAPRLAPEVRGSAEIAQAFKGRSRGASPALIDGEPGAVWAVDDKVRAAFVFTIAHGKITAIDLVMDPARLAGLDFEIGD
ncbi:MULTISPECIES: sigma-70 family RNA polymerase sigma factor [Anaeromyxobacter]|uniref:sigma-70 family RNA polymerase sigma factor n=1 Tax=Anaeromyxobacter TaxID=161492 RepID=UPI001F58607D|nr:MULTISPECIES: sigma-70 family RNA polymerase sigma factor [unclassified Anaeromyxobacter]